MYIKSFFKDRIKLPEVFCKIIIIIIKAWFIIVMDQSLMTR